MVRTFRMIFAMVVLLASSLTATVFSEVAGADPTIDWNTADPHIAYDDDADMFYMYTTQFFDHQMPVWYSSDAVNWSYGDDAMPTTPVWGTSGQLWAPGVIEIDGTWVAYFAQLHNSRGYRCIGTAISSSPTGPFVPSSSPLMCNGSVGGHIDPFPYRDDNGDLYLLWKDDMDTVGGSARLRSQRLSADGSYLTGSASTILTGSSGWEGNYVENPALASIDGKLWLTYSANNWKNGDYATGYAVCDTPMGPCTKTNPGAPLLGSDEERQGPGGASVVTGTHLGDLIAYHGWNGKVRGDSGAMRRGYVEGLQTDGDTLIVSSIAATPVTTTECRTAPASDLVSYRSSAIHASTYRLYCAYFLRYPETAGFNYWAAAAYSGGWSMYDISDFFAGSDEFDGLYGSLTDREFVIQLYNNIMMRNPDTEGLNYWVQQMGGGLSRGNVVLFFSDSPEFRGRTATE